MSNVTLKLTRDISVEGQIIKAGRLVEVSESDAVSLLNRGAADLATEADAPDEEKGKN